MSCSRRRAERARRAFTAAVLASAAVAIPAHARPTVFFKNSFGLGTSNPAVAFNAVGQAVIAYLSGGASGHVEAGIRPPAGGPFADAGALSADGAGGDPHLFGGNDGTVIALWIAAGTLRLTTAQLASGAAQFGPAVAVSPSGQAQGPGSAPAAAEDSQGNEVIAWDDQDGGRIAYVARAAGASTFAGPFYYGAGGDQVSSPRVLAYPDGDVLMTWRNATTKQVLAAVRPHGGSFPASATQLSITGNVVNAPEAALDGQGAVVAWNDTTKDALEVRTRPPGGTWAAAVDASAPGTAINQVAIGAAPDGAQAAAWVHNPNDQGLLAALRGPGQPSFTVLGAQQDTGQVVSADELERDPAGGISLLFEDDASPGNTLELRSLDPGATAFGPEQQIAATGAAISGSRLRFDGAGNGAAVWTIGGNDAAFALLDSGAGPTLSALSIPATTVTDTPTAFAVQADDFSRVPGPPAWDFGDGGTGQGQAPNHRYATPGTYTVTVTATDGAGFASSASGQIAVAQGPPRGTGSQPVNQPAVSTIKGLPHRAHVVRRIRGIATDDEGVDGVADVEVALVGLVRHKGHKVCERLVDEGLLHATKPTRQGRCKRPPFVEADGTVSWSVKLAHALPTGSWVAYSRATDAEGLVETVFKLDRNEVRFSVKPPPKKTRHHHARAAR